MFGHLVDGFQTLDLIEKEPVDKAHRPLNELEIEEVVIHANPIAEAYEDEEEEKEGEAVESKAE